MLYSVKRSILILIIFISFAGHTAFAFNPDNSSLGLELTEEEEAFIREHRTVTVSASYDYPPIGYMDDGQLRGLSIDLARVLFEKLDMEPVFIAELDWHQQLDLFYDGKIDVISEVLFTENRAERMYFSEPFIQQAYGVLSRDSSISGIDDIDGLTVINVRGFFAKEVIEASYPACDFVVVDQFHEAVEAIHQGRGDVFFGNKDAITYWLDEYGYDDLHLVETYIPERRDIGHYRMATLKDNAPLISALNKAYNHLEESEKEAIAARYGYDISVFYDHAQLTPYEISWLEEHDRFTFYMVDDFLPMSDLDGQGVPRGMAVDYLNSIGERLSIDIEFEFDPQVHPLKDEGIIGAAPLSATRSRIDELYFSNPIFASPIAVYAAGDHSYVDMSNLKTMKVIMIEDHAINEYVSTSYGAEELCQVVSVANVKEALEILGHTDAVFLGDMVTTNRAIDTGNYNDVRIVGFTDYEYTFSFAVRRNALVLEEIIDKTIAQINAEEGVEIRERWLTVTEEGNERIYILIVLLVTLVAVMLYIRTRQERKRNNDLEKLSYKDALTNIYNRRYFNDNITRLISHHRRGSEVMIFGMMDVDHFKKYNDTYQHSAGDVVLARIGETIRNLGQRESDYCFRLGGEEFGILYAAPSRDKAEGFAEKLRKSIEAMAIEHKSHDSEDHVTVSIGLRIIMPDEEPDRDLLYSDADKALYEAKRTGRNRVVIYPYK